MKKEAKMALIVSVSIIAVICIVLLIIKGISKTSNESQRNQIKIDALSFIKDANIQFLNDTINDLSIKSKCYQINGYNGIYNKHSNYVGSIYVTDDSAYIWLSDGKYHATGTMDNIVVTEYSTPATQNCDR